MPKRDFSTPAKGTNIEIENVSDEDRGSVKINPEAPTFAPDFPS